MRYPILHEANAADARSLGVGPLSDAVRCFVVEELDGMFELEMQYPADGVNYSRLQERMLIAAPASPSGAPQLFRIYRMTEPMRGIVTVYAQHVSYDLDGIPCRPFTASSAADAMAALGASCTEAHPFTFETDKNTEAKLNIDRPRSARAVLFGESGSILSTYKGDYEFDNYRVMLKKHRGGDHGYRIRYGVNLIDLEQERNCQSVYSGVFPYWYDEETGECVTLPEGALYVDGDVGYTRVKVMDFGSYFDEKPTADQLRSSCRKYIDDNEIGKVKVSIDLSFAYLKQYEEYKNAPHAQNVVLGDTVHVDFERLGISRSARIARTKYDVLRGEYIDLHVGTIRAKLDSTLVSTGAAVEAASSKANSASKDTAKLAQETQKNSDKISLVVGTDDDDEDYVRGDALIDAINAVTEKRIAADRIVLDGYVTARALEVGETLINGDCIKTGAISSTNYSDNARTVYYHNSFEIRAAGKYAVPADESGYYWVFTTNISFGEYGATIEINLDDLSGKIVDRYGFAIDSFSVSTMGSASGATLLDTPIYMRYFSESGTMFDLETGNIISKTFSIIGGTAYIGGEIKVKRAEIGGLFIDYSYTSNDGLSKTMISSVGNGGPVCSYESTGFWINHGDSLIFINDAGVTIGAENAFFSASDKGFACTGVFKVSPYTDSEHDISEVVTKQDLINLGLIKE